jgi:hypothetical protein
MIRKSGNRFSEKIMLRQKTGLEPDLLKSDSNALKPASQRICAQEVIKKTSGNQQLNLIAKINRPNPLALVRC